MENRLGAPRYGHCHSNDLYARLKLGRPGPTTRHRARLALGFGGSPSFLWPPPCPLSTRDPQKRGAGYSRRCVLRVHVLKQGREAPIGEETSEKGRGKKRAAQWRDGEGR